MKSVVLGTIFCLLLVFCVGSVGADTWGGEVAVVGVSSIEDSVLCLAVVDGGICYRNITWTVAVPSETDFVLSVDGSEVARMRVSGVSEVQTLLPGHGAVRLSVVAGNASFSWSVIVINQTAEEWIPDYLGLDGPLTYSDWDALMLLLRGHAITIIAFVIPCPFVARWVRSLKDRVVVRVV